MRFIPENDPPFAENHDGSLRLDSEDRLVLLVDSRRAAQRDHEREMYEIARRVWGERGDSGFAGITIESLRAAAGFDISSYLAKPPSF